MAIMGVSTKGKLMYQVKVYTRQNAILVMESPILESRKEADEYYLSVKGIGQRFTRFTLATVRQCLAMSNVSG